MSPGLPGTGTCGDPSLLSSRQGLGQEPMIKIFHPKVSEAIVLYCNLHTIRSQAIIVLQVKSNQGRICSSVSNAPVQILTHQMTLNSNMTSPTNRLVS